MRYRGYVVTIPRSWPVYDLSRNPHVCVRFDRHALYLGTPGTAQRCPAHAVGRTEAILLEPVSAHSPRAANARPQPLAGAGAHATSFVASSAPVAITATWSGAESVVEQALHRRSLPASPSNPPSARPRPRAKSGAHAASAIYTGLGFDACAAPSQSQMSAWGSSSYRAIGIYIGGVNAACSQPNLTTSWVSAEIAAGWHLVPTYVGVQAPSNSCGCAAIVPSQAAGEGAAAARTAASDAAQIGIPAGNPIYYDMEGYTRNSTNTSAVLSFLSAWTSQLHASGYASGVYSSAGSGITDLANQQGSGYQEPDDVWIADWNGQQTTSDPYVPAADWSNHQRLHQYRGDHNETYGGVTINIDNDYLDGATADTTSTSAVVSQPALPSTPPSITLTPLAGGITNVGASWSGAAGIAAWRVLTSFSPSADAPATAIAQAAANSSVTRIAVANAAPYFAVQALSSNGQVLGTSAVAPMPAHISLFGPNTFVPARAGPGGIPASCFTGASCHIKLTMRVGPAVVASTGSEYIGSGSAGFLYYRLTALGRRLLSHARGNRLSVQATARDSSGATATTKLTMIAFSTSGHGPPRHIAQSPTIHVVNTVDYVSSRGAGGILVACRNTPVCTVTTTVKVGNLVIARTRPQSLGANELGYLTFALTPRGRSLLSHARGNQLGAQLTVTGGSSTAIANIALVRFN